MVECCKFLRVLTLMLWLTFSKGFLGLLAFLKFAIQANCQSQKNFNNSTYDLPLPGTPTRLLHSVPAADEGGPGPGDDHEAAGAAVAHLTNQSEL